MMAIESGTSYRPRSCTDMATKFLHRKSLEPSEREKVRAVREKYRRRICTAGAEVKEQMVKTRRLMYRSRALMARIDKILDGPNGYGNAEIKRKAA
jgi:hypothetical protein